MAPPPLVKICCIASVAEAQLAQRAGAAALGLVSAMPSGPGVISDAVVAEVASAMRGAAVRTFLLTARTTAEAIAAQQRAAGTTTLQLVDHLPAAELRQLRLLCPGVELVQVIHVTGEASVADAQAVAPWVDAVLLDSGNPALAVKELGGTGRTHDWALSRRIRDAIYPLPLWLAGGLRVDNVAAAIAAVQPHGLDLCTGVRSAGRLDGAKLGAFMAAVAPRRPSVAFAGLAGLAGLAMLALAGPAAAQGLDTRLVASALNQPLFATAPLADGRLFVVEKGGLIKVVQGGVASTFFSVAVSATGEQGLLGLAFDPGYGNAASAGFGRFFVDCIDPTTLDTVVASYRRNAVTGLADPASRVEVMRIDQPAGLSNHKAGWIGFKPGDANNLYIATGDGGGGNDPDNRAQNKGDLLGKLLRVDINRDDFADASINYGVPLSNPFVGQAGARGEIYALGLRNPFRNSFDSANGNLWIADVGQGQREEIDFIAAASAGGQNFGWRQREGNIDTPGISDPPTPGLTGPLLDYTHSFGAAITGGYVVRDAGSALNGRYVFGDFVSGRIFSIAADGSVQTMAGATELSAVLDAGQGGTIGNIASFGQGASGEFYIVDYAGKVLQVVPEPATALLMLVGAALLWARRRFER